MKIHVSTDKAGIKFKTTIQSSNKPVWKRTQVYFGRTLKIKDPNICYSEN